MPDGFLRNVIDQILFFSGLQAPKSLVFTVFLIGSNHMDIERVRTALKMLAPEERAIIQDFFFTESPIPVKELVEKYGMPKSSIYRKRDDALKALKKILGNA